MHHTKHGVNGDSTACMWHKIKAREVNVGFHSRINDCVCVQLHDAASCDAQRGLWLQLASRATMSQSTAFPCFCSISISACDHTAFLSFISAFRLLRQDFSANKCISRICIDNAEFTKHTGHHGQDGSTFASRRDALVGCCSGPKGTPIS
jgi:hypothetical protein